MMFGFNTAVRGLLASQRSLYTTNHNINNINTKGYSRQQVSQRATSPFEMPGIGFLGTGTEIYNVERVRDSFVDFKYWNESAPMGEWNVKRETLTEIEKLMGEPSNNSFRRYLDDFYTSLEDMSKNPSDISFREPVRENAMAFTRHINETAKRLENMKKDTQSNIEIKVDHINSITSQIATLNKQIYLAEVNGKPANDLRDRRELLVDDLSEIVNVRVDESPDGKYTVSVGGNTIVDHLHTNEMSFKQLKDDDGKYIDEYELTWDNGGKVQLRSGELKGLMDLLTGNGEGNTYRGIPFYEKQLNEFARGYADKFNQQHKKGYTSDGEEGIDFFTFDPDSAAATITIHEDILADIHKIAAAGNGEGSAEDANNILELIKQREDKGFFGIDEDGNKIEGVSQGTPDDFIKAILSSMAVDSMQADRIYSTQEIIRENISRKRQSISGVSLEEESADMIRFQHTYVASSRMITTMDALLDLTVNRLGLVGR